MSWDRADGVDVNTGQRADGLTLVRLDLDGHKAAQDPRATFRAIVAEVGRPLAERLAVQRSLGGRGFDVLFLTSAPVPSGTLVRGGQRVGECMANGSAGRAHADTPFVRGSLEAIPTLTEAETTALLTAAGHRPHGTDRDAMRRIGDSLTSGYERYTRPDVLDGLLVEYEGRKIPRILAGEKQGQQIGRQLWHTAMDGDGDRSAVYANLLQSLALHAGPLGRTNTERWQRVRALAEHTEAGGKAREKTYRLGKDTAAIIGKIASGAPRDNGGTFTVPYWSRTEDQAAELPAPEPEASRRTPGRPAGDRDKLLTRLRRELASMAPDAFGRVIFTLAELQTTLGRSRRSVQSYLHTLAERREISRPAQLHGNGPVFVLLLSDFGGATNSPKPPAQAPDPAPPASDFGGATPIALQTAPTPQIADQHGHANKVEGSPKSQRPAEAAPLAPGAGARPQGGLPFGDPPTGKPPASVPSRKRTRKRKGPPAFGEAPLAKPERGGLPRRAWTSAPVEALIAERDRKRAQLPRLSGTPARRVGEDVAALNALISDRRDVGLTTMLYINVPDRPAEAEPRLVDMGAGGVVVEGGVTFIPVPAAD